jgi:hypothetical protein
MIIHLQKIAKGAELIGIEILAIYYGNLYNIIRKDPFVIVLGIIIETGVVIYYV